jgi:hypothetical protein
MDDFGEPWPFKRNQTSWQEIARYFLKLDTPEKWKDKSLQGQIADALKALGWRKAPGRVQGKVTQVWFKGEGVPH